MATEQEPATATPSPSVEEWAGRAADVVEAVVGGVHDKVVRPAIVAGRAVVFGILIATAGLVVLVLLAVGLVRLLDVYAFGDRVWASDALIGFVACVGGFALWTLRSRRPSER